MNMMKKKLIVLLILFETVTVYARETTIPISLSYFGETIVHPGLSAAYEYTLHKNFFITPSIGMYLHTRYQFVMFLNGSILWRKTFSCGYSMEYSLGAGYMHTWQHGGKTYTVSDDGVVSQKTNLGHPAFMPTLELGFLGWDFRKKTEIPLRIHANINIFGQYPFNDFIMPHGVLKIGGTYFLKVKGVKNEK